MINIWGKKKAHFFKTLLPYLSLPQPVCTHKGLLEQRSIGVNNVDAVPGPAGGAQAQGIECLLSKVAVFKRLSLLCQLGSERAGSQCLMVAANL